MNFLLRTTAAFCCLIAPLSQAHARKPLAIEGMSLAQLSDALAQGRIGSVSATQAYLARIARLNLRGPALHAVIALNPDAVAEARAADRRRASGKRLGPLDGVKGHV